MHDTLIKYLDHWSTERPDTVWLRDRKGDVFTEWNWQQAQAEVNAMACWQERHFGSSGNMVGILSRNRAHWLLADLGTIAAGNVVIPMFTTLAQETAKYVMDFTDMKLLFVGETENWEKIRLVLPEGIVLVTLPGVELADEHLRWDDLVAQSGNQAPAYQCQADDLTSIVFTSGTTGVPKGVMQTHSSTVVPINRFKNAFGLRDDARCFSYLPLSHIAERQIVGGSSLINCSSVYFNENMTTLLRDLSDCRPSIFFGPPRVWEQIQQMIIAKFGSQEAIDEALAADREGVGKMLRQTLGLDEADYMLTAAAPTPPALIHWYEQFGLVLMEGFGQTEAMGLIVNTYAARKIGSIGQPLGEVEVRLSAEDELQIRADGCATGYYNSPEKTAETFVDGWVNTGDKARIDEDGFIFLTGRVKDYFKTIQGKFVAPTPIENAFADNDYTEQLCLLGRGYSKTVMVCVLSALAQEQNKDELNKALLRLAQEVNKGVEHHARIGAVIVSSEPWTIDNGMLTPTLKIRREQVDQKFGERAQLLARQAAEQGEVLIEWM
jgi:long-chain acyl-CoA synthetase